MRHLSIWQRGLAAMLLLLGFAVPSMSAHISAASPADYRPNEVLVKLNPSANRRAIVASHRLQIPHSGAAELDLQPIYRFQIADGTTPTAKAAELMGDRMVMYAEPNYVGELPEARQRPSWIVGEGIDGYATQ